MGHTSSGRNASQQVEEREISKLPPTFGRFAETQYEQMALEQQDSYRLLVESTGAEPYAQLSGPLKIWANNARLATAVAPLASHFRSRHCSLSERESELAACIISVKWHTPHSIDQHAKHAKKLGLPAEMIDALVCGLPVSFPDKREQVIYEMTTTLAHSLWVPQGLYDRAVIALGHNGVTDVIALMGYHTALALTLAFYDVPTGAVGLKR